MITQVKDTDEGLALLAAVRDLLNQCWEQRDTIQPVTAMRRAPRPLDVWTLLPQSNCKRCGEATCMAFVRFPAEIGGCCSKSGRLKSVRLLRAIPPLRIAGRS